MLADYLTVADLAGELGVTVRTIRNWEALGEGPPRTQLGRRALYHRPGVLRWLAQRQHTKDAAP
ncbi:MAG TPA: helix-turn-helix domain-containing protein [Stellaceae bacterium]|nr:helix-turn-helix domain-containing protein [Stellaceae bacterium]